MDIEQVGPVGAEITDIDLSVSEQIPVKAIEEAFLKHSVLVFKNQKLSPEDLKNISLIWGEPLIHPVFKGIENYPEIIENGHLYLAQPPLYRISFNGNSYYAQTEESKRRLSTSAKTVKRRGERLEKGRHNPVRGILNRITRRSIT